MDIDVERAVPAEDRSGTGWTTGAAVISGVTTKTSNGAVVNAVTMTGSDARTPGTLVLVSSFRVFTNVTGNLPGFAVQRITFVPEPALLLLLGTGALGLALHGRVRRSR